MKRRIKVLTLFLSVLVLFSGCDLFKSRDEKLIMGLDPTYYPYEYLNQFSKLEGFDIDFAKLLAEKMHKTLVMKSMPFYEQKIALEKGDIDIILNGMTITPEREKEFTFVPYHSSPVKDYYLVFWKEIPDDIQAIADFEKNPNWSISVKKGTLKENYLLSFKNISIKPVTSNKELYNDLKKGNTTAILLEPEEAAHFQVEHPDLILLKIPLPEEFWTYDMGIAVKKGNVKLAEELKKAVQELKDEGKIAELEKGWFKGRVHRPR